MCMLIHKKGRIMRTNIDLDDQLMDEAFKHSDVKTKKDLIHQALKEFIENKKRKNLGDLRGKLVFEKDYDYKSMRK